MKLNPKEILIVILLLAGAFLLRFWRYYDFPVGGETADESAWTLLGASFIQERVPSSWSYFAAYENYHYKEGVFDAPIVRPVFDHPPLFSFLPGTAHSIKSFWLDSPSFKVIRLPLVLLGVLNTAIFWLLVRRIFARTEWAAAATLFFATVPEIVFGSRLVVAENLLVTWILLLLYLGTGKPTRKTVIQLAAVSMAAVLTKIAGLIVPVSLAAYGLATHQRRYVWAGIGGAAAGLATYALYGALYNWELFTALIFTQSARELGLATLQNRLFLNPVLVKHIFFDGWKLFGLFAAAAAFIKQDKKLLLSQIVLGVSLLFISLTVGESTFHGWYDFVLWPGLIVAITAVFREIYVSRQGIWLGFAWLLLLPALRLALVFTGFYEDLPLFFIRGLIGVGWLPFGFLLLSRKQWFRPALVFLLLALITANIITVLTVSHEAYWTQAAFFELPQ